jgi:hypothetical protein
MKGFYGALDAFFEDHDNKTPHPENLIDVIKFIEDGGTYTLRPMWRTHVLPDYLGADTKGGAAAYTEKTGWSLAECREWNRKGDLSCPTAISEWGVGDVDALKNIKNHKDWTVGTGTFALNAEISSSYGAGKRFILNTHQIEVPSSFYFGFCSSVGYRGMESDGGPYDLDRSGWGPTIATDQGGQEPSFLHGGSVWRWGRQKFNIGGFLDGRSATLFADGRINMLSPFDFPLTANGASSAHIGRKDETESSRLAWHGYREDFVGAGD